MTSSLSRLPVWHWLKCLVQTFCWGRSRLQTSSDYSNRTPMHSEVRSELLTSQHSPSATKCLFIQRKAG